MFAAVSFTRRASTLSAPALPPLATAHCAARTGSSEHASSIGEDTRKNRWKRSCPRIPSKSSPSASIPPSVPGKKPIRAITQPADPNANTASIERRSPSAVRQAAKRAPAAASTAAPPATTRGRCNTATPSKTRAPAKTATSPARSSQVGQKRFIAASSPVR